MDWKNLVLIDSRILDISSIVSCLTENTDYLVFCYETDTYSSLKTTIASLQPNNPDNPVNPTTPILYDNIAIIQHNKYQSTYSFLKSEPACILSNVQTEDPTLQSWTDWIDFLGWLKNTENSHVDLLACDLWSNPNWVYVIQSIRESHTISIRASVNTTGVGGDFILESDNVDTIGIYFTPAILDYRYAFGGANPPTSFIIYRAIRRPTGGTTGDVVLDVSYALGGYTLSGFNYSVDGTTFFPVTTQNTTTNVTVSELVNTTAYQFYLQVVSTGGDVSAAIYLPRVDPSSVPIPPTINSITNNGSIVTVSFNEPKFDGGANITGYTYDLSSSTTVTTNNAISVDLLSFSPYTFQISVVATGTYVLKLYATNANGSSLPSTTTFVYNLSKYYRFDVGDLSLQRLANYSTGVPVYDASLSSVSMLNSNDSIVGTTGSLRFVDTSQNIMSINSITTDAYGLSISFWYKSNATTTYAPILDFGSGVAQDNITMNVVANQLYVTTVSGYMQDISSTIQFDPSSSPFGSSATTTNIHTAGTVMAGIPPDLLTLSISEDMNRLVTSTYVGGHIYCSTYNPITSSWSSFKRTYSGSTTALTNGIKLTNNGNICLVTSNTHVYYCKWIPDLSNYSSLIQITDISRQYAGIDASPNGKRLVTCSTTSIGAVFYTDLNTYDVSAIPITSNDFSRNTLTKSGLTTNVFRNGTYDASASGFFNLDSRYNAFNAFNGNTSTSWAAPDSGYNGYIQQPYLNGAYQGGGSGKSWTTSVVGLGTVSGEWLQIKLPYNLVLKQYELRARDGLSSRLPNSFYVLGSNDGSTWYSIDSRSGVLAPVPLSNVSFDASFNTIDYFYYRLVVTSVQSSGNNVNLSQWNLYGKITTYSPTLTRISSIDTSSNNSITISKDARIIFYTNDANGKISYVTWNGTSYVTQTVIGGVTASANTPRVVRLSYDDNILFFTHSNGSNVSKLYYSRRTSDLSFSLFQDSGYNVAIPDCWGFEVLPDKSIYYINYSGTDINNLIIKTRFYLSNYDSTYLNLSPIVSSFNDNTWRHIAWTIDPSGRSSYYINGTLAYPSDFIIQLKSFASTVPTKDTTSNYTITNTGAVTIGNSLANSTRTYMFNFSGLNNLSVANVTTTTAFTKMAWIYSTSTTGTTYIFDSSFSLSLYRETANIKCSLNASTVLASTATIAANTWTHITVTYNGSTITLYMNGVSAGTLSYAGYTGDVNNTWYIGSTRTLVNRWTGYLDDIRQYNRTLTITDISCIISNNPYSVGIVPSSVTRTKSVVGITNNNPSLYLNGAIDNMTIHEGAITATDVSNVYRNNILSIVSSTILPNPPVIIRIDPSFNSLIVSFLSDANGGPAITAINYSTNGTGGPFTSSGSDTSPITITGLTNGTTYSIALTATSSNGTSSVSTAVNGIPYTVPAAPDVFLSTPTIKRIDISFSDLSDNGAAITNYFYNISGGTDIAAGLNTVSLLNLSGGYTYTIYVKAFNIAGNSAYTIRSITATDVPSAPSIYSTPAYANAVDISFSASASNGSPVTGYFYSISGGISNVYLGETPDTYTITGLDSNTTYVFSVIALNGFGFSPAATTASITTSSLPTTPAFLQFIAKNKSFDLSFGASSADPSYPVTAYSYTLAGDPTEYNLGSVPTTYTVTTYNGQSLTDGTAYVVSLRSKNSGGYSDAISGTAYTNESKPVIQSILPMDSQLMVSFTQTLGVSTSITNYSYSLDSGNTFNPFNPPQTTSPLQITGLLNGVPYGIAIRGTSNLSNLLTNPSDVSNATPNGTAITSSLATNANYQITMISSNTNGNSIVSMPYTYLYSTPLSPPTNLVCTPGNREISVSFTPPPSVQSGNNWPLLGYTYSFDGINYTEVPNQMYDIIDPSNLAVYYVIRNMEISGNRLRNRSTGLYDASMIDISMITATGSMKIGKSCGVFNGTTSCILTPTINDKASFTLSCWIYLNPSSNTQTLASCIDNNGGWILQTDSYLGFLEILYSFGTGPAELQSGGFGNHVGFYTSHICLLSSLVNRWTHIAITYEHSISKMQSFLNGTYMNTDTIRYVSSGTTYTYKTHSSSAVLSIGVQYRVASNTFQNYLANGTRLNSFSLHKRPLTAAEIYNSVYSQNTRFVVSSLSENTTYNTFYLKAFNQAGVSDIVRMLSPIIPNSTSVPSSPILDDVKAGNAQLSIYFTAPTSSETSSIISYKYSLNGGSTWTTLAGGVPTSPVAITGLVNGTTYSVVLIATNSNGDSIPSNNVVATPFAAPTQWAPTLSSVEVGINNIYFYFTETTSPPTNASIVGYKYSLNGAIPIFTSHTVSPIVIANVPSLSTYSVTLITAYTVGDSSPSNSITTSNLVYSTNALTTSDPPTSLVAIVRSNTQIDVSFLPPSNTGGLPILGYKYQTNNSDFFFQNSTSIPYSFTGLVNNTSYTFALKTVTQAGDSTASSSVTATTFTNPGPPTITRVDASYQSLSIVFTAGGTGGTTITGYQYSTDGGTSYTFTSTTTSPIVITGLDNQTSYDIIILQTNSVGDSNPSNTVTQTTFGYPVAPVITEVMSGYQYLDISFTQGSNGGTAITNYKYSINGLEFEEVAPTDAVSPIRIEGLADGVNYTLVIRAVNIVGDSSDSNTVSQYTFGLPDPPTLLSAVPTNQSGYITFTAPTFTGRTSLTSYQYRLTTLVGGDSGYVATENLDTSFNITPANLTNGTSYTVVVRCVNIVGDSIDSNALTFVPRTVPTAPTIVSITPKDTIAYVVFTPNDNGGNAVTRYEYALDAGTTYTSTGSLDTSFNIGGLTNGTTYVVRLRAVNAAGASSDSSGTVVPSRIPDTPVITGIVVGDTVATVSFNTPYNGGNAITKYTYSINAWATSTDVSSTATQFVVTGLTNGTSYIVLLRAYNAQGYSVPDASQTFVPASVPDPPTIDAIDLSNQRVTVRFTAPVFDGGNAITKYTYSINGWTTSIDLPSTVTPFDILELTNGVTYVLRMRTHNIQGYSADASTAFVPCTVPDPPVIQQIDVSNQKAILTISSPANNGGNAVSKMAYTLNGWVTSTDVLANATTVVIPSLVNGTQYVVALRAYNIQGASVDVSSSFTPSTNPDPPTIVDISENDQSVYITFAEPVNTGGNAISKYHFSIFNNTSLVYTVSVDLLSTARNIQVNSLTNGTTYTMRLKAFNIQGSSVDASRNFVPSRPPDAPTIGTIVLQNAQVTVSIAAPGYDGGNALTKYTYYVRNTATLTNSATFELAANTTSFVVSNVSNGTQYILYLREYNGRGESPDASATFIPRTVPDPPIISSVTENDQNAFVQFVTPYNGGNAITKYAYSINGWANSTDIANTATSFTIGGLTNGTAYVVLLRAYNAAGYSEPDASQNFIPSRVPDSPTILDLSENDQSAFVSIQSNYNGGNALTKYTYTITNWNTSVDVSINASNFNIPELVNGVSYLLELTVSNLRGNSAPVTRAFIPSTVPTAPTITSVVLGNTQGRVVFTPSDNSGGNAIVRYEYLLTPGNSSYLSLANLVDTSFVVSGLTNGNSYSILLRAVNLRGPSPTAQTTFIPRTVPSAPTITSVILGNRSTQILFDAPTDTGGNAITQYSYTINNGAYVFTVATSDTSFNVTRTDATTLLNNGTSYSIQLTAENAAGSSSVASTTFIPRTVPDPPVLGTITLGDSQVNIAFTAPANNGGNAITNYAYSLSESWTTSVIVPVTDTSFTITGLTNGTSYNVYVRAYNAAGYSAPDASAQQVIPRRVPDPFAGLTIVKGNQQIQFTIVFGSGYSNGGNTITQYEYRLDNGPYNNIGLNTTYTVTGLTNGRYYVLYVRARNAAGPSPDVSALTFPRTVPTAPMITSVTLESQSGVVYFSPPDSSGGAVITDYVYTLDSVQYTSIGATGLTNQYFTISGLTNGTSYTVALKAQNEAGYGALSSGYTFIPRTVPNAPTIETIVLKDRRVDVSLGAPSYDGGNAIVGYEYVLDQGSSYVNVGNTLFFTISTGLVNGQSYILRVRARNAAGPSIDTSSSFIPRTVPSAPTLTSVELNDQSVFFQYVPSNSSGGNTITNYEYSINNWSSYTYVSVNDTSFNVTGLVNGVSYNVQFRARNAAGVSVDASQIVIPRTIPTRPTIVSVVPHDSRGIIYYLESDSSGGNAIVRYEYVLDTGSSYTSVGIDTSFTILGLNNGQTYVVRLRAVNAAGTSPDVSATLIPRTVPSPPILSSYDENNQSVIVYFTTPVSNGGNAITKYVYTLNQWNTSYDILNTDRQYTVTGLLNGTSYIMQLRAYNDEGYSSDMSFSFIPRRVPDPPSFLRVEPHNARIDVSFNLSAYNGGNAIVRYEYALDDSVSYVSVGLVQGFSIVAFGGVALNNGETYLLRLRAVNAEGASIDVSTSTVPRTIPSSPSITNIDENNQSAIVSFAASVSNGGNAIVRYEYALDAGVSYTSVGLSYTFSINGLNNGQGYKLRMRSVNAAGVSPDISTNFTPRTVPNPPQIASIDENDQSAIVYFSTPVYNGGNTVTSYLYTLDSVDNPAATFITLPTLDLSFQIATYGGQSLANGTSYILRMRAQNAEGHSSDASLSFIPRRVPDSPTISSVAPGNQSVSVTYHASNYDGGNAIVDYRYRLTSIHGTTSYISIGTTYSFQVIGLSNSVEYTMTMVAVNAEGNSTDSSPNTFIPFTAAASPTIIEIIEGNQQVTIRYTAPTNTGGRPITGYKYSLSEDGSSGYVDLSYTLSNSVYTSILQNIGLQNATQYSIIIVAVNAAGYSSPSVVSYFIPYTYADPPTITSVVPSSEAFSVYYSIGFNGGDTVTSILYSINTYNYYVIDSMNPLQNPFTVTGLTNGTVYPISIKAVNRAGASVASNSFSVRPRTVPNAPVIEYVVAGNQSIVVHFTAPSYNGGDAVTNYSYHVGVAGAIDISINTTISPYTITGLTNGISYSITLRAINAAGSSAASNTIAAIPYTNPGSPTNIVLTASLESIGVQFAAPTDNGGYPITNYLYSLNGGIYTLTNTTATSFFISSLTKGTSYQVKMKAVTIVAQSVNDSLLSNIVYAYGTSDPPTIIGIAYGNQQGVLSYVAPSFQGGGPEVSVLYYTISVNGGGFTNIGFTNPYTITGLTNGTSYTVVMRAVNLAGSSVNSNSVTFVPKTVPTPPTITSVDPSNASLTIRYTGEADGGSEILKYMYSLNSAYFVDFVDVPAVANPPPPIVVEGLTNGVSYFVRMVAMNAVGYSNFATYPSVIPSTVPDVITIVSTKSFDGMQRFTIATPFNGGSPLLGYSYTCTPEVAEGEGAYVISGTLVPTVTEFYVMDLSNGYYYNFSIRAYNGAGYSTPTSYRILAGSTPFPPVFTSVVGGVNSITLNWRVTFDGGTPIVGARYSLNGGDYVETGTALPSLTIPRLLRGNYSIRLIIYNNEAESRPSTTSATVIDPPTNSSFFSSNSSRDGNSYIDKLRTDAAGVYSYYGGTESAVITSKPKSIYKTHADNLGRVNARGRVIGKVTYRPDRDITNLNNNPNP